MDREGMFDVRYLSVGKDEEAAAISDEVVYWTQRDMALDHDHCFLCGVGLSDETETDEHVFPKWLQGDFDLWNEKLTLLNGSTIRYRALTIPCCNDCNGFWLSQVENTVSVAFRVGADAVAALEPTLLSLWMAKIYYGIHFKEVALPARFDSPRGPTIVAPDQLARFSELHHVLQATRQRVRFRTAPGSVRVLRSQIPPEPRHQFDYRDLRLAPFLAIRAGGVVVLASLLDWGAMSSITTPGFEAAEQLELHPSQFVEVAAFGGYVATKFNRKFGYLISPQGDHDFIEPVIVEEEGADTNRFPFDPIVHAELAHVLAEFTGLPMDAVYTPHTDQLWTCLRSPDGSPAAVTLDQAPFGTPFVPPGYYGRPSP